MPVYGSSPRLRALLKGTPCWWWRWRKKGGFCFPQSQACPGIQACARSVTCFPSGPPPPPAGVLLLPLHWEACERFIEIMSVHRLEGVGYQQCPSLIYCHPHIFHDDSFTQSNTQAANRWQVWPVCTPETVYLAKLYISFLAPSTAGAYGDRRQLLIATLKPNAWR